METWLESTGSEKGEGSFVGGDDFGAGTVFHWLGVDGVAVVIVEDEELAISRGGGGDEAAGGISGDFASGGHTIGVQMMGSESGRICWRWTAFTGSFEGRFDERWDGRGDGNGCGLGGALVRALLVHVSFVHGNGKRRVAAHLFGCKGGPRGEAACVDGVTKGG